MTNKQNNTMLLPKRIIELRKAKKMSQLNLAMRVGITQESISSIERGTSLPKCNTLAAIAEALDCSIDYLLGFSDIKNPAIGIETLTAHEKYLINNFQKCSSKNKELLLLISDFLTDNKISYKFDDEISIEKNFLFNKK